VCSLGYETVMLFVSRKVTTSTGSKSGLCNVPASARHGVSAIAASEYHDLALGKDGRVVAWGCDGDSDLGQCDVPASARRGVSAIAVGDYHSLALKRSR
jgi:alpha-tubulin suppressor-like RCC1 family protein